MIFNFPVANPNICNRWLLMTSKSHTCHAQKGVKACGSEQQKAVVH